MWRLSWIFWKGIKILYNTFNILFYPLPDSHLYGFGFNVIYLALIAAKTQKLFIKKTFSKMFVKKKLNSINFFFIFIKLCYIKYRILIITETSILEIVLYGMWRSVFNITAWVLTCWKRHHAKVYFWKQSYLTYLKNTLTYTCPDIKRPNRCCMLN